jgi:hypothetical protein
VKKASNRLQVDGKRRSIMADEEGKVKQATHEYRQGQNDEKISQPEKTIKDIVVDHPDTKPYYDGRAGKPLEIPKTEDDNNQKKAS